VKTYIALLRGLGGKYTLPMRGLVELMEGIGLSNVRTYIQSGNAIFRSEGIEGSELSESIKTAIGKKYGFAPHVIVLTADEFKRAAASNPYREAESEPKSLHLTFLASKPKSPDLASLERIRKDNERFTLKGKVFYLHAPDGVGRSKLFARIEKSLGVPGTARNWRTICHLKATADEQD
jgi:uncharacterized protein (DUF1697 family)